MITMKRNDRRPVLRQSLTSGGKPINLTGATVAMFAKNADTGVTKIGGTACVIEEAANGRIRYDWGATDTDTSGTYKVEFEVTFTGGIKQTWPTQDYLYLVVKDDLG